jgi:hypothetical protein
MPFRHPGKVARKTARKVTKAYQDALPRGTYQHASKSRNRLRCPSRLVVALSAESFAE